MSDPNMTGEQGNQQTTGTQTEQNSNPAANAGAGSEQITTATNEQGGEQGTLTGQPEAEQSAETKGELQRLREILADGDPALLKSLERYKSEGAIAKAFKEGRSAAKNAGKPLALTDKSTPEEVKAYREALGIPEAAADYPVAFREDYTASEADAEILGSFKEYLHSKNVDPRAASVTLEWYQDFAQAQQQELSASLAKTAHETQNALKAEWGGDTDGKLNGARELMKSQLGDEGFTQMMDLRLMDGSRLQDNLAFVKMMAALGDDYYGGNAIMTGDVETTSKTVKERIDELMQLRATDSEKYFSDAVQGKLTALYAQQEKLSKRA